MARPSKTLEQHVRDETFRARRHHEMLGAGELLRWKSLASLQEQYRAAEHDFVRRRIAVEFEKAAPAVRGRARGREQTLEEVLAKLGPPGSADRAVNFFPRFLFHYAGSKEGKRFRLEPFQESWVRDLYERDRRGRRVYKRGLLGTPVGNGKTPILGGLGLLELVDELVPTPAIYALSSSREQAGSDPHDLSRLHALARHWVEESDLRRWITPGKTLVCGERNGMFKILPAEGRRGFGVNPTFGLVEELGAMTTTAERYAVDAIVRRLVKREGMGAVAAATNAGWSKQTPLGEWFEDAINHPELEVHRDGCLLILRDRKKGFLMHWYGAPDDADLEDPKVLRACNPLSVVDVRELLRDRHSAGTDDNEWRRNHGNQWSKTRYAWLASGVWDRLHGDTQIPDGADITVAVDAARTHDTTSIAWQWISPEGRKVVRARVWSVRANVAHDVFVPGGELVNEKLVEPFIHGHLVARHRYRIRAIAYDPKYFNAEARHLDDAGFTVIPIYPHSTEMGEAVVQFEKDAHSRLEHNGDGVLRAHVEAIDAERAPDGSKKIGKRTEGVPIDAGISSILANYLNEIELPDPPASTSWRPL